MEQVLGVHHIAELCECNGDFLNDSDFISESLRKAVEHANATLIEEVRYEFTPQGITAVCLLSESHISIHTWPEEGKAAVDVYTCGNCNPKIGCDIIIQQLYATNHTLSYIER